MKAIYKFSFDCGRQGSLNGVFVARKDYVKCLTSHKIEVYFGEVLGKHSEIFGIIKEEDIIFISDSKDAIKIVEDLNLSTGFNPFEYDTVDEVSIIDIVDSLIKLGF